MRTTLIYAGIVVGAVLLASGGVAQSGPRARQCDRRGERRRPVPQSRARTGRTALAGLGAAGRADRHRKEDAALPLRRRSGSCAQQQPEPLPVSPARLVRRQVRPRHRSVRARPVLRHASRRAHLLLARDDDVAAQRPPRRAGRRRGDHQGTVQPRARGALRRARRRAFAAARLDGDDPPHVGLARRLVLGRSLHQDRREQADDVRRHAVSQRGLRPVLPALPRLRERRGHVRGARQHQGLRGRAADVQNRRLLAHAAAGGDRGGDDRAQTDRPRAREERAAAHARARGSARLANVSGRAARHDARAPEGPAAVHDVGPVHGLPRCRVGRAVRPADVADAAAHLHAAAVTAAGQRRRQRVGVRRVALVADGARGPRSGVLLAARGRAAVHRRDPGRQDRGRSSGPDARDAQAAGRRHVHALPRRDGQAPERDRSRPQRALRREVGVRSRSRRAVVPLRRPRARRHQLHGVPPHHAAAERVARIRARRTRTPGCSTSARPTRSTGPSKPRRSPRTR